MINISNVSINYKKNNILSDVSFVAKSGECIGLLGVNGSGKSSLLSTISGAKKLEFGDITYEQLSLKTSPREYKKHIGYVSQENALIPTLSAMDNLRLFSPLSKKEITSLLSTMPLSILGIMDFIDTPIKSMSGGMKKRLSIASVLINNPDVLLLDEPFAALDIVAKNDIKEYIKHFISEGKTVIIASHEESIFSFCNTVYLITNKHLENANNLPQNTDIVTLLRNSK